MSFDLLTPVRCPSCDSPTVKPHNTYTLRTGEAHTSYYCAGCDTYFAQTCATPLAGLRTPLSRIQLILDVLNDRMGINAVCRTFHVSQNTLTDWTERLASLKETLMLYALSHRFLQQLVEGDEVYTKVHTNVPAPESEGWTIVLLDLASRFLRELQCGEKDRFVPSTYPSIPPN